MLESFIDTLEFQIVTGVMGFIFLQLFCLHS